jgi:Tfp pilus assembly PilM family ATPase
MHLNFAIPSKIAIIKVVNLPDLPLEELRIIALDEATNQIPFPLNEANIDFEILESTKRVIDNRKRVVDVLILAIQKSIAQKLLIQT